jgi:K+/H+ antiporter YhaU regulatory subunit KhtT
MKEDLVIRPVYQQIALDLANRIAHGEFEVGTKIHGRSTLAGQYNVSPETVRRAVILLEDMGIIEVMPGSGILVKSIEESVKYIEKFKSKDSISSIKKELKNIIDDKRVLEERLTSCIDKLMDTSERFKNSNPFAPLEVEIPKSSKLVGKTIAEVNFWQNTGATIVGIRRESSLILSPGPYAIFMVSDTFIMIGEENSYERIKKFINE